MNIEDYGLSYYWEYRSYEEIPMIEGALFKEEVDKSSPVIIRFHGKFLMSLEYKGKAIIEVFADSCHANSYVYVSANSYKEAIQKHYATKKYSDLSLGEKELYDQVNS